MASEIPFKAPVWRIPAASYLKVLEDADGLLEPLRGERREEELREYRERLERAREYRPEDTELEEQQLANAEQRLDREDRPRWYLTTKLGRIDRPDGTIEDLAPDIDVPGRYDYAAVRLDAGQHSIEVTLGSSQAKIVIRGSDSAWLVTAERWAKETIKAYRPRWWWMVEWKAYVPAGLLAIAAYYSLAYGLPTIGVPLWIAFVLAMTISCGISIAFLVASTRRRTAIAEKGMPKARAFLTQAGLIVAGAVAGQVVAVLWGLLNAAE